MKKYIFIFASVVVVVLSIAIATSKGLTGDFYNGIRSKFIKKDTDFFIKKTPAQLPIQTAPPLNISDAPVSLQSNAIVRQKFLTLIIVSDDVKGRYEDNIFEKDIRFTENHDLQVFYVFIWSNGQPNNPKRVSLYKFNSLFDPTRSEFANGGIDWINYRESFNILNVELPEACTSTVSGPDYFYCSNAYLNAFKAITATIVRNQPASHYGIKYVGHGVASSGLFEGRIYDSDAELLLSYINSLIGKKIDFLDWDTNCGGGNYNLVLGQYRYADYILASDLNRGGYTFGQPDPGIPYNVFADALRFQEPTRMLDTFFSPWKTIRQSLVEIVNSQRTLWENALRNSMIRDMVKQSISIYDTSKFADLMSSTNLAQAPSGDILDYIRRNYSSREQKFYDFRFHYISNKDFFTWDENSNGFRKN